MPFKSEKQRAWMHINEPQIAQRWEDKYGSKPKPKKKSLKIKKKK